MVKDVASSDEAVRVPLVLCHSVLVLGNSLNGGVDIFLPSLSVNELHQFLCKRCQIDDIVLRQGKLQC
jgi:hypothetical protein